MTGMRRENTDFENGYPSAWIVLRLPSEPAVDLLLHQREIRADVTEYSH